MNCSDIHKQALGQWSPDGRYLAGSAQNRLLVRDAVNLKLVQVQNCMDKVGRIEWSPDSRHILTELCQQGILKIWSVEDANWQCRIDEALAGLTRARWSPSSNHIFIVSDFQLYVSVWSLEEQRSVVQLQHPKFADKGFSFSRNGRWLALLRRFDCRDFLTVLSFEDGTSDGETLASARAFTTLTDVAVDGDCADLVWGPGEDTSIVIWERPARATRFLCYSRRGELLSQVCDCGLMRAAYPSPSAHVLVAAGFDGRLHLLSGTTMKPMTRFVHDLKVACAETGEKEILFLREEEAQAATNSGRSSSYVRVPCTVAMAGELRAFATGIESPVPTPAPLEPVLDESGTPRQGVGVCCWSPEERYVATRHDGAPTVVWIWDVSRLCLAAVLLHRTPVRTFAWDPSSGVSQDLRPRLAISTSASALHLWAAPCTQETPSAVADKAVAVAVPCPLSAVELQWRHDGLALLLQDRDRACVCCPGCLPEVKQVPHGGHGGYQHASSPPARAGA